MRPATPSFTALIAAMLRAYHYRHQPPPLFEDTHAHLLIRTDEWREIERLFVARGQSLDPLADIGCQDHDSRVAHAMRSAVRASVLARARYMEDVLAERVAQGVQQYVIIGAGLDTCAVRRRDLANRLTIFEVDHAATQEFKRQRLEEAGLAEPENLCFVSADLEQESLAGALKQSRYSSSAPAVIAWPGVTVYLTHTAIASTIRAVARCAAPGSELLFDYFERRAFSPDGASRMRTIINRSHKLGEPMISGFEPAAMAELLEREGFHIQEDLSPAHIDQRYFAGRTDGLHATEHVRFARAVLRP